MKEITLQAVEQELLEIANSWDKRERILGLARRIGVQLAVRQIDHPEAA